MTPTDSPQPDSERERFIEAVAWQWRRRDWPADGLWCDGTEVQCRTYRDHYDHEYEVRALGVLPFPPDRVRRDALEEAAGMLEIYFAQSGDVTYGALHRVFCDAANVIRSLATKGQS